MGAIQRVLANAIDIPPRAVPDAVSAAGQAEAPHTASTLRRGRAVGAVEWASVAVGVAAVVLNLRWLGGLLLRGPVRIGIAWLLPVSVFWLLASCASVWLLRRGRSSRQPVVAGLFLIAASVGYSWLDVRFAAGGSSGGYYLELVLSAATGVAAMALIYVLYDRLAMAMLQFLFTAATCVVIFRAGVYPAAAFVLVWCGVGMLLSQWLKVELRKWDADSRMFAAARDVASRFVMVNARLQDSIDRVSMGVRIRERTRVAREIHDSVGYTLTALLIQVQAAQDILRADPAALGRRLERLEDLIRSSIQDVREEVSELRDESVVERSGSNRWRRLCESFSEGTGVRVRTAIPDDFEQVPPGISELVYRITQEALTNSYRHGAADLIDVSMAWDSAAARILVRISDNGQGVRTVNPGNGLRGMRERTDEIGGSVVWQTEEGKGFDLGVEIPWDGSVDE